jgi:hypothetical protein
VYRSRKREQKVPLNVTHLYLVNYIIIMLLFTCLLMEFVLNMLCTPKLFFVIMT